MFCERIWKNSGYFPTTAQVLWNWIAGCGALLPNRAAASTKFQWWQIQFGLQRHSWWNYTAAPQPELCVCDRVTSPQVQTQTGIKENAAACSSCDNAMSVCKSAIVRAQYSMSMSTRLHCMSSHLCASVFLWGQEQEPLSPPVFASWSKPLPCHRSFWCSGTIEPVEVLISLSIHLNKGQASPPSPVRWAKGWGEPWQDSGSSPPAGPSG